MNHPHPLEIKAGVDLARVRASVGPVLSAHGVELVDLEWLTDRGGWVLRLTIERVPPPGAPRDASFGVTLDDCAEVSRDASAVLDGEDLIPHHYSLEVSSPGLDRPLRSPAEFARFVGETAKVKLRRPAPDGQRVLRGPIAEPSDSTGGRVAVVVDGKRIEVAYADVAEANLVFELKPSPKPGAKAKASGASARPHGRAKST
jgi:ribosome maturation factor RimP